MPNISISQLATVIPQFRTHWDAVETQIGAVNLPGGINKDTFDELVATFEPQNTAVVQAINYAEDARIQRDIARARVVPIAVQFGLLVRGAFVRGSRIPSQVPRAPNNTTPPQDVVVYLNDIADVWARINTLAPADGPSTGLPFVVPDPQNPSANITLAQFNALRLAFADYATEANTALRSFRIATGERATQFDAIYNALVTYRAFVEGRLTPESPLARTLPRISPKSGSTPPAVGASGTWNAAASQAVITIVPLAPDVVTKFDVVRYDVRYSPGGVKYDRDLESTIGQIALDQTTFSTNVGLTIAGNVALFKVYTMTGEGNERGSATIKITRT